MKRLFYAVVTALVMSVMVFGSVSPASAAATTHWSGWKTFYPNESTYSGTWQVRVKWYAYTSTKYKISAIEWKSSSTNAPSWRCMGTDWYDTSTSPDTNKGGWYYAYAPQSAPRSTYTDSVALTDYVGLTAPSFRLQLFRYTNSDTSCSDSVTYAETFYP